MGRGAPCQGTYTPYASDLYFDEHTTDDVEQIIIVGAGIAGVSAAVLISQKVRNATLAVYEKLPKVGGTWARNVYPGVRCDVPSHAYQLSFAPNTEWSEYYPKGQEIQEYYESVIEKYGITPSFHTSHEVLRATWLKDASRWVVEVKDLETGNVKVDTAEFFVSAQGRINIPSFPAVPGLYDRFGGDVIHTALWPEGYSIKDKRVAIIGNGASGQQLLPNILKDVAHIDHYVRTKTWVTATFAKDLHEATADSPGGPKYTDEQRKTFREDPKTYLEHRRFFNLKFYGRLGTDKLGSQANEDLRQQIIACMRERLGGDEEWLARVLPDYAPGCKRLTPAPGYLEALKHPKVEYVTDPIISTDSTGIVTADGTHRPVDVVITATGFKINYNTYFPIIGADGVDACDKFAADGPIGFPATYLGVMVPGYPNYFTALSAQGNARGGTVPLQTEIAATFIAKAIRKIQSQSYSSLEPREDAAIEFNQIVNTHFEGKVTTDKCNSWYKQGGGDSRNLLAWPGTFHHRADILREPRWEDFHFVRRGGAEANRFEYFGNGSTRRGELADDIELTKYLKEIGQIDLETVHELWNE
ncbi:flavin-binding monooxygenase [Thozetella sp. PMI_491]|nr:flavin-binding monooxygenase [Thozetella sp. PMI_491]